RVSVAEYDALRVAGSTGRVDDRVGVVGLDLVLAARELRFVPAAAALAQLLEGDLAGVGLEPDDVLEGVEVVADLLDLLPLAGVVAEHGAGAGVAGHPLALLWGVGRIDRDDDAAGGGDRVARQRPF